jgi:hypothetical protein
MATVKKATKAKNLSAGPSKKTTNAGPVDPQGKWTGIQERTLGSMKKGGKVKKNWIQGAVNPEHKGFCTPLSKKTCTPKRKALAHTLRKMAKKK